MITNKTTKRSLPVQRTDELVEAAIECLANGETLSDFCRKPGRPDRRTITRWVAEDQMLQVRFTEARRIGHDVIAEATIRLADAPLPPGPDGRIDPALVQQRRLQVDTRLRLLAKWDSARYGDKCHRRSGSAAIRRCKVALSFGDEKWRLRSVIQAHVMLAVAAPSAAPSDRWDSLPRALEA